jgi:hypothetical protein
MAAHFVDSSALLKRYRYETGTERVAELLDGSDRLVVSRLAEVEISVAIVRRARAARTAEGELNAVLAMLDRDIRSSFDVVEIDSSVIRLAVDLTRKHGLRAADAIQLASALSARTKAKLQELMLISTDQELNSAASAEGLSVVDPTRS